MRRILFASPHSLIDFSSGAAIATGDALELLARNGFECRAFCASKLDLPGEESFEQILADLRLPGRLHETAFAGQAVRFANVQKGRIPSRCSAVDRRGRTCGCRMSRRPCSPHSSKL